MEQAKQRAAESYQELLDLRQSLDQSIRESSAAPPVSASVRTGAGGPKQKPSRVEGGGNSNSSDSSLNVSMAQVDQLMSQFRSSLTGMSGAGGAMTTGASQKFGLSGSGLDLDTVNSLELNSFLERYSDRLVDLVGDKLVKKMNNK